MKITINLLLRIVCTFLVTWTLLAPPSAMAQDHVVPPAEIQKDVAAISSNREKNQAQLEKFISTPEAQKALKSAHVDLAQVNNAISSLNDDELAQLSARSEKAQKDFVGGRITDRDLILILLGIVALILIIVAVR
jgi:hypothetical protein